MQKAEKELIEEKIKGVLLHQQANYDLMNIQLDKILSAVTITNGRVTALEKYTSILKFFQKHPIITGLVILGCIFLFETYDIKDIIKIFK